MIRVEQASSNFHSLQNNIMNILNTTNSNSLTTRTRRLALALLTLAVAVPMASTSSAFAQTDKMAMSGEMSSKMMAGGLTGTFAQVTHATKGTATVVGMGAKRTVRLSNFQTAMGPQLRVYLVSGAGKGNASIKKAVVAGKFVSLGNLKALKGNQSYAIPASSKIGKGSSIVIWCDKFDVAFGSAALS
jgi:hypothetical protein